MNRSEVLTSSEVSEASTSHKVEPRARLNKAGDRRGLHNNHYALPKISEDEEQKFTDQDLDHSLRTKKFKFNLQGYNVRNFIHAVIKSPLVQDLLTEEFLAGKESSESMIPKSEKTELGDGEPEAKAILTRSQKRKLPKEATDTEDPFLALLQEKFPAKREKISVEDQMFPFGEELEDTDDDDDYFPPEYELPEASELFADLGCKDQSNVETAENIASRTRKRLNLELESINKFELPMTFDELEMGCTSNGGCLSNFNQVETSSCNDLSFSAPTPSSCADEDDVTWRQWLQGLLSEGEVEHMPQESDNDSDPDFDYNLCVYKSAWKEDELEKVKRQFEIPQEEKEFLVQEALNYLGITKKVDVPSICRTLVLPKITYSNSVKTRKRKYDDSLTLELLQSTLKQQMQMFVQLLTQNFLLCYTLKNWKHVSNASRQIVLDLKRCKKDVFGHISVINLELASKVVSFPFNYEIQSRVGKLANQLLRIIVHSEVFMYRELLPYCFFRPKRFSPCEEKGNTWLDPEDCAIALGMSDFAMIESAKTGRMLFSVRTVADLICHHLLPTRNPQRILRRYYFLRESDIPNPVKYLEKYKELPVLPTDVAWICDEEVKPPYKMQVAHAEWPLPMWMQILKHIDEDTGMSFVESIQKTLVDFSDQLRAKFESTQASNSSCGINVELILGEDNNETSQVDSDNEMSDDNPENSHSISAVNQETLKYPQEKSRNEEDERPNVVLPTFSSSPKKFRKSPAKVISDKLVRKAMKTSIGCSPKKIIKMSSPTKSTKNFPDIVKTSSDAKGQIAANRLSNFSNNFGSSNDTNVQKRVIRRRKNWQQSKKNYSSMVSFTKQSFNPEPTPELESRIQSMREEILLNMLNGLGQEKYETFLTLLSQLNLNDESSHEKVREISLIFEEYPKLYREIAKLVNVEISLLLGLYFEFRAFERAKLFLQKVEMCSSDSPKLFNVILDTFASSSMDETSIWNNVTPLLEFNPLLIDEFSLFFKDQPIPDLLRGPFEEIIVTESSDSKSDLISSSTVSSKEKPADPVFEEFVLLDDDDEAMVRERAARKVEKRSNRNSSAQNAFLSNCIVRDLMCAKMEQLTTGKVEVAAVSAKKMKRPATPHTAAISVPSQT